MKKKKRFKVIVDVHLFLRNTNKLLFLKRANTGYMDGYYHVPAGHKEGKEKLTDALIRESKEEIGIEISPKDIKLVHIMHNNSDTERLAFFFEVKKWKNNPKNLEPEKHSQIAWFKLKKLPRKIVPYVRKAIRNYLKGIIFSYFGWK